MNAEQIAVQIIQDFESLRLNAYFDKLGNVWTIGYGATGHGITEGTVWTSAKAVTDLTERVGKLSTELDTFIMVPLSPVRKACLIDFAYNIGVGELKNSTLMKCVNTKDFHGAAEEFRRWNHAGGVTVLGLTRRREAERALFKWGDLCSASI